MNGVFHDKINEVVKLIIIEKRLGKTSITKEDVYFVKILADEKRYPRAEYILASIYLFGCQDQKNRTLGLRYLARSSKHASYDIQLKIAYIYHIIGDFKKKNKCLKLAKKDLCYFSGEDAKV